MPITQLYCEGGSEGTDIRIISQISPRGCVVRAIGSKNRLAENVIADRQVKPSLAGLVDRDFDCVQSGIAQQPIPLFESTIHVGWSWERKEIENYLLDPAIVEQTCVPKYEFSVDEYQRVLQQAADSLKFYTAARTALSCFGFKNNWGPPVKKIFSASYSFPKDLSRQTCLTKIEEIVNRGRGDRVVTPADVIQKFENILLEFSQSGHRQSHPLIYHSGKDLLLTMKPILDTWLPNRQTSIQTFTERIVQQIERANDVWTWMPEWAVLRDLLENTDINVSSV